MINWTLFRYVRTLVLSAALVIVSQQLVFAQVAGGTSGIGQPTDTAAAVDGDGTVIAILKTVLSRINDLDTSVDDQATDIAEMQSDIASLASASAQDSTIGQTAQLSGPQIMCLALTSNPSDATTGQPVRFYCDPDGVLYTRQAPLSKFRTIDLDESEEEADDTAGELCSLWFTNTTTATIWLKVYDADADDVTVGTTTPALTIGLPGNTSDDISGALGIGNGCWAYTAALTFAATTGVADNDTGAPGANAVILNAFYR